MNDTLAFKNALSSLGTSGGTLIVPTGTYLIVPTLTVKSNVSIMGDRATIKAAQTGYNLLYLVGTNIAISGITVDGDNKALIGIDIAVDGE